MYKYSYLFVMMGLMDCASVTAMEQQLAERKLDDTTQHDAIVARWKEKKYEIEMVTRSVYELQKAKVGNALYATVGYDDFAIKKWNPGSCAFDNMADSASENHTEKVNCLVAMHQGLIASGSADEDVKIWCPESKQCIATLMMDDDVSCLAEDGNYLGAVDLDGRMKIWDVANNCQSVYTFKGRSSQSGNGVSIHSFMIDDNLVLIGEDTGIIKTFDMRTKSNVEILSRFTGFNPIEGLVKSKDANIFYSGSGRKVCVWDKRRQDAFDKSGHGRVAGPVKTIKLDDAYASITESDDGKILFLGSNKWAGAGSLLVKDAKTYEDLDKVSGGYMHSVAAMDDGREVYYLDETVLKKIIFKLNGEMDEEKDSMKDMDTEK